MENQSSSTNILFCPNPTCEFHNINDVPKWRFYRKKGFEKRKISPPQQRYQCLKCKKGFCDRSFSFNYRLQKTGHISARIFFGVVHNRSNRSLARELGVSEGLIRDRIYRLSKMGLYRHYDFIKNIKIREDVAFDGLENFARSQYEPNNINHIVGRDSLFCYYFNYSPLNRKGRSSDRQKSYLGKIENSEGRYDPKAVR